MIDVTQQINAVRRQVGTRVLEAGEARTVTISQTYDATIEDMWDACTNPARISRWFLPVSGDLRVGGRYQLQGNAGGTVERCDPPKSFAATWEYGEEISWIEVRLEPGPEGGTRLEIEHIAHVDDERWAEFGPGAVGVGWDMGLMGLAIHLSSGKAVDPKETAAWSASEDGKRFMSLSSEWWCEANIAAGADEASARAAAERTTTAYTGTGTEAGTADGSGTGDQPRA
ncbi:MAG: SRPBCC family protein [Micromonosporaceae bacterium]